MKAQTKILIVEDEPFIAHDIEQIVTSLGYTVTAVVASGEQAIQCADKDPPDLALIDIELAGKMDGIDAAEHIRAKHDIPILFLTAYSDNHLLERAKVVEPHGYLLKPFGDRDLHTVVEVALYKHRMERTVKETNRLLEQEIAERKRTEAALRESEGRFRKLFEESNDAVFIHDFHGQILDVNQQTCKMLGYSKKRLLSIPIPALHPEEELAVSQKAFQTVHENGAVRFESQFKKEDGTIIDVEISSRIVDPEQGIIQGLVRNITERKQIETALHESEQRYRDLFQNMSSGVAVYEVKDNGRDFVFKDFNKAAEQIDGDKKDALIGKSIFEMRPGVEEFGLIEVFRRVWETGEPAHHPVTLYKDKRLTGWYENFVYKLPSGEIVAVFDNITKRKQAEEELRKYRNHLEELVKERTTELTEANERLEQELVERKLIEKEPQKAKKIADAANQAKSKFLANMSHELRTPLNAILGYAQLFEDSENLTDQQKAGEDSPMTKEQILIVEDEVTTAIHLEAILTKMGYDVLATVPSGEAAIQQVAETCPDLVLMDIHLEGEMDGIETAGHIHEQFDVPVIYLTAYDDDTSLHHAQITEPYGYLIKPYQERELYATIKIALYKNEMEKRLQESEEKFRELVENIEEVFWIRDIETRTLIYLSPNYEKIWGQSIQQAYDQPASFLQSVHPDDLAYVKEEYEKNLETPITLEYRIVHPDTSIHWIWVRTFCVRDQSGELARQIGVAEDITKRKQAEEALKASESRYRELFNNMGSGVAVYEAVENGQDFVFTDFNRAGEQIDNIHKEDLLGKSVLEMFPGVKDLGLFEVFQRVWQTGQPECHPISLYQDERIVGWRENSVYKLPSGEIVAVYDDITERKQTEQELEKHRHHLEELVKGQTAELTAAIEQLSRVSSYKDEFLANMSHELRTPLNAIMGYAQILKNSENLTERQQEGLDTIKSSGDHLLALINEILDLSKIESGQMELQTNELYLPGFLKHITDMISIRAEEKGLSFVYESDGRLPAGILADERRLRQILLNLLGNAVKFTEKGRVTLRVGAGSPRPNGSPRPKEGEETSPLHVIFEIEDTGPGIAPEQLKDIFLPFRQVSKRHAPVEGAGLGLAISYKLVAMMGGELQVKSTANKGSTFWFALPLPEVPGFIPKEQSYGRKIVGYKGERRIVFVVDDDEKNRAVLVGMLLPLGFRVLEAKNGKECIEKALKFHPDIILLDLRMPVLDGFGAAQQIRKAEGRRQKAEGGRRKAETTSKTPQSTIDNHQSSIRTVIIAVSASVFEETRERALNIGFNDFLFKPFQLEDLLNLFQKHLQIEWLYEDTGGITDREPQVPQKTVQVVPLPSPERETLCHFAELGITKRILSILDNIEQQDSKYIPFVKTLRQLAKHYQFERILELLEPGEQEK